MKICQCAASVTHHLKCTQADEGTGLCAACRVCMDIGGECCMPAPAEVEIATAEAIDGEREDVTHSVIERVVTDLLG